MVYFCAYKLLIFYQWIPIRLPLPSSFTMNLSCFLSSLLKSGLHLLYLNAGGREDEIWNHQLPWPMASSLEYWENRKASSDSCLFQSLQLYLRCHCRSWHLSNNKSLQFSLWDRRSWIMHVYADFFTCDRCSMGNLPNILRKATITPVKDTNEMFPSVYYFPISLTISYHHMVGEHCSMKLNYWWESYS